MRHTNLTRRSVLKLGALTLATMGLPMMTLKKPMQQPELPEGHSTASAPLSG